MSDHLIVSDLFTQGWIKQQIYYTKKILWKKEGERQIVNIPHRITDRQGFVVGRERGIKQIISTFTMSFIDLSL